MKKIRIPGTTANIGPGFDCLGIALSLYNEYQFEENDEFILKGFNKRYSDPKNNLIVKSYLKVFELINQTAIPLKIEQIKNDVPSSRGLGSSSCCIVAGIMMANEILGNYFNKEKMLEIATLIEGHPDNVAPAIYGGCVSTIIGERLTITKINVSPKLKFTVCIPSFELSTSLARSVLPQKVNLQDAVYNISHAISLIKALEDGDLEKLNVSLDDKLHQPYRLPLIKDSTKIIETSKINAYPACISGAGPTLLIISYGKLEKINDIIDSKIWALKSVEIDNDGAIIYE